MPRETKKGRSARSRNTHRASLIAFANWCADPSIGRLASNPFKGVPKADEKADPRRRRRSMTEAELVRLLDVARRRPLLEALTVRRGKRKGEAIANVRPEVRERLEALGRERALIYKTLVLTGLRKNELASLTVAQLRLDGPVPHVELDAADEKNREGNGVVIRADLAEDLRALARRQAHRAPGGRPATRRADPGSSFPADTLVFDVPTGLVQDLRPRPEARRHLEARRAGPHARRACTANDFRHALEPGRGAVADGASRDAAFRPEAHGERLHRSEALGRSRGSRRPAEPCRSTCGRPPSESKPEPPGPTTYGRAVALPVALTSDKPEGNGVNR